MRSVLVSRRLAHVLTSSHAPSPSTSIPSTDSHHLTHPSVHRQHTNSYIHGTSNIPLRNETLGQTLRNTTERVPDKEFCAFLKYPLRKTYEEFYHDNQQIKPV
uniref:Secreted protein n=1 Tax=Caenorhabditis tropicalis TaxID=1561998 RepID=A0A1I7UEJ3_9PELO